MDKLPECVEKLIYSFMIKCDVCKNNFQYPIYTTCHKCYKIYKTTCWDCYKSIHRPQCNCNSKLL